MGEVGRRLSAVGDGVEKRPGLIKLGVGVEFHFLGPGALAAGPLFGGLAIVAGEGGIVGIGKLGHDLLADDREGMTPPRRYRTIAGCDGGHSAAGEADDGSTGVIGGEALYVLVA